MGTPSRPKYKTLRNGRTVLGGGGITPDVYIDHDTTKNYTYANMLNQQMITTRLAHELFVEGLEELRSAYPTVDSFIEGYNVSTELIDKAIAMGTEAGIEQVEESMADSRELLGHYIKGALASALWGVEGYIRTANNHFEPTYGQAMSIIADKAKYNALLGIEN